MRCRQVICAVLILCGNALPQNGSPASPLPDQFAIGRHTFFDFGPPNDYYELLLVRPAPSGTSIERILLTPAGDACVQPAKIEVASASLKGSVVALLGNTNPCTIPEKKLRRELKRCKKCLVFSGINVAMQVQCGTQTRIIRSDILDKDMFDPAPNTPEHTSWTMQLLSQLDKALGPGVMDKPMFALAEKDEPSSLGNDSELLSDVSVGKYDTLFQGARDKPSDLYRAAQIAPPLPTIRLVSSTPFQPEAFVEPGYPPIAKVAHIEGTVHFTVDVDADGRVTNFNVESGHPMLRAVTEKAMSGWKFPRDAVGQRIHAVVEFATNCVAKKQ
jgi:TonB family protein